MEILNMWVSRKRRKNKKEEVGMEKKRRKGFTLVELMVVIIILGILAAVIVPRVIGASQDAQESALLGNITGIRNALELYASQHNGRYPGCIYNAADGSFTLDTDDSTLRDQLTKYSDGNGQISATLDRTTYPYGPYIQKDLPKNTVHTGTKATADDATIIADATAWVTAGDNSTGWVYKPQTGQFAANASGTAKDGTTYFSW